MRCRDISRVPDFSQWLIQSDCLSCIHLDGTGPRMCKEGVSVTHLNDDIVPRHLPKVACLLDVEGQSVLQYDGEIPDQVNTLTLRPAVFGLNYSSSNGGVNRLPPTKTVPQLDTKYQVVQGIWLEEAHSPGCWVSPYKVICVSLAEHIGAMAGYLFTRRVVLIFVISSHWFSTIMSDEIPGLIQLFQIRCLFFGKFNIQSFYCLF